MSVFEIRVTSIKIRLKLCYGHKHDFDEFYVYS